MKKGFTPVLILVFALILVVMVGTGMFLRGKNSWQQTKPVSTNQEKIVEGPERQSIDATSSAESVEKPLVSTPTAIPAPTTKTVSKQVSQEPRTTIKIHTFEVSVCASEPINCFDPSLENPIRLPDRLTIRIVNLDNDQRWEVKNQADFTSPDLSPGHYRASVYYTDPYAEKAASCEGCRNNQGIGESRNCGYNFYLQTGDNVRLVCKLNNYADPIKSNYSYPR